ncbi:MAG: endopeptidase La [Phycisphaerae bacterium]|nr:endopeptidase La [Phycisphaerae bacterium]
MDDADGKKTEDTQQQPSETPDSSAEHPAPAGDEPRRAPSRVGGRRAAGKTVAKSRKPPAEKPPAESSQEPQIPEILPILPIRDSVAFPGTIMPLNIGREKSKRLVERAVAGDKLIGVIAQRYRDTDDPTLDDIYRIGTVCAILKLLTLPDGTLNVIVHGVMRFGLVEMVSSSPFLTARIQARQDHEEPGPQLDALLHTAKQAAYRVFELSPSVPEEARIVLDNIDTAGGVADFLAANLSVGLINRQELLETFDVAARLRKINTALAEQVDLLELANKIQSQVRTQIDKSQREYYLQEQLKAIQRELGETDGRTAELTRFRERIEATGMPEAARKEAERELERLARIPQASPEYSVAVDYLTWLCDLPWTMQTEDQLDLRRAERILNEDHYGLEKVKKRILEFLAVRKLNPQGRGPILCFLGPPGVGKTSLGQSIARALGRKFVRMSLGGLHDEAQLRGHRRTYIGAMPGRILQEIRKVASGNPVFMLDEVDKIGKDFRGDPASALLEVLDPQQNHSFTDNYLDVPFDLSKVLFIATANYHDPIPAPLQDRMETLQLAGYTTQEKLSIAKKYLVPRQLRENGLRASHIGFAPSVLETLATRYTREAGVRELERQIGAICRAVARRVAQGRNLKLKVTDDKIIKYLGPPPYEHQLAQRTGIPGVATGLAFTPAGGEILFIEAAAIAGEGRLTLTGQLGEIMRESAQAAFSVVKARAGDFGITPDTLRRTDVHVHVPAGAIPKDGPSAGIAIFTAIVSLHSRRPCQHDVAMTGEITLTGRVLAIGGVKEKVIAAHRAGIRRVILPADNRKDLQDIPPEVRRKLKFSFAATVDQVLRVALTSPAEKRTPNPRRSK